MDAETTQPVPVPGATRALLLGTFDPAGPEGRVPARGRHTARVRYDGEVLGAAVALAACAAASAWLVPYGSSPWGPAWWGSGAVTCLGIAVADRRRRAPRRARSVRDPRASRVDVSSPISVRGG